MTTRRARRPFMACRSSWTGPLPPFEKRCSPPEPLFFVSTNSRSLPRAEAEALAREVGGNLRAAASETQAPIQSLPPAATAPSAATSPRRWMRWRPSFPSPWTGSSSCRPSSTPAAIRLTILTGWTRRASSCRRTKPSSRVIRDFGFTHGDLREWVQEKTAVECAPTR